jgi:hypothetical protein
MAEVQYSYHFQRKRSSCWVNNMSPWHGAS